ncbi:MAG: hypothetical protein GY822_25285, partial [Deltaproteobacteria bacterium]|nr:hypothetical protein [Deltaproteobacteria bacterium]
MLSNQGARALTIKAIADEVGITDGLRRMTAWELLHKTRVGTRYIVPNTTTTRMQILGRTNKNNVAFANMA